MPTVKNLTVAEDLDSEGVEPGLDSEVNLLSFQSRIRFWSPAQQEREQSRWERPIDRSLAAKPQVS